MSRRGSGESGLVLSLSFAFARAFARFFLFFSRFFAAAADGGRDWEV